MSGFSTRAIRASARVPDVGQKPTAVPIFQTATFATTDADELADVLTDLVPGFAYTRLDNPTTAAFAAAVAELEGAEAGYPFASGMAAIHAALLALLGAGDRVVATSSGYGTTQTLLRSTFGRLGVDVAFVDVTDHAAVEAAVAAGPTAVLYAETISNPTIVVADHAALAAIAHRHGAAYVVDNTFASPYVCRPVEWGADLVIESATKFIGGHSDTILGVVTGTGALVDRVRAVQIDTGATASPLNAFLALRGIATLAVRLDRQSETAAALDSALVGRSGVTAVHHPSLPTHPQHELAARQLDRPGPMLAFELAGGRDAGAAFIDALTTTELTASLGSVHTMVVHPPSTTHRQLDEAALEVAGIAPGLLRVSVGLEDADDLVSDFLSALDRANAAGRPDDGTDDRSSAAAPESARSTDAGRAAVAATAR